VASGKVLAYMAGRLTAEEILELYTAYLTAIAGTTLENTDCLYDDLNQMGADTYADASLVLIPSGYSTGVVYGQRPLDSNSQITFTRASDATRVINGGLIEKVRTNLFAYSEQLEVTYWAKTAAGSAAAPVVTANAAVAPDGTTTADRVYFDAVGTTSSDRSGLVRDFAFTIGQTYTISAYAKSATGSNQILQFRIAGAQTTSELTATGDWQRFTATFTATTSTTDNFGIQLRGNNTTNESDLYLWGMQLELSDVMTDYIETGASAVSVGPVSNVPRIDYTGGGCGKLLLEPQRTNSARFSEQLDNAAWTKGSGVTVTANQAVSPDGYQNADLITFNSANKDVRQTISGLTTNTSTISVYLKAPAGQEGNTVAIGYAGAGSSVQHTLTSEWVRIELTGTNEPTNDVFIGNYSQTATSVLAWGLQVEVGASYATSYIPTLASSVTRVADAASKTGITNLIGQTEGTLYWEGYLNVSAGNQQFLRIGQSGLSFSNAIYLDYDAGSIRGNVWVSSALQARITTAVATSQQVKIAFAYKANDFVLYLNGTQIGTDTSGTIPASLVDMALSYESIATTSQVVGGTNQALLFKKRLSNDELAALTTL
jgi:hypothetical protein